MIILNPYDVCKSDTVHPDRQVGRILHGVICHFPQMATILVFTASTFVTGVSTLLIAVCQDVTSELAVAFYRCKSSV